MQDFFWIFKIIFVLTVQFMQMAIFRKPKTVVIVRENGYILI